MVEEIFTVIVTAGVSIITAVSTYFATAIKNKKKNKIIKVAQILQKLPTIIKSVEECCTGEGTGNIKKLMVLNQCQIECVNLGIEYNEKEWSAEIEKILETPQKKTE